MAMRKLGGILLINYRYFLWIALIIIASSAIDDPLQNFINVVTLQAPFVLIYTCGMTIVMLTGGLDLSLGSVAALSTCIGAMVIIQGDVFLGLLVTVGIGALCGFVNGFLITAASVPPFIATYGMDWTVRGLTYIIMNGVTIFGFNQQFKSIAEGKTGSISNLFFIALVIFIVMFFFFHRTTFGRNVFMVGSNIKAAKLSGVRTGKTTMIVYIVSGVLASIAGILYVARLDAAEAFLGKDFGLVALSAALIGGTSLEGGKGGILNTVIGVLIMVFLTNTLNVWKVSVLWQDLIFGVVIVIAAVLEKITNAYVLKNLK
jgi:ribose transport system permease protein